MDLEEAKEFADGYPQGDEAKIVIESLIAEVERLRGIVRGNNGLIDEFVCLGYDLHIHDQSGSYPNGLDRKEWEKSEINRILEQALKEV